MTPLQRETLLSCAGWLHFCQLPASALFARRMLRLQAEFDRLSPVARRVVHVLALAVTLTVNGTGLIVLTSVHELALHTRLSIEICAFLGVFWSFRAGAQFWYARAWPRTRAGRISHALLVAIFVTQSALYLALAGL